MRFTPLVLDLEGFSLFIWKLELEILMARTLAESGSTLDPINIDIARERIRRDWPGYPIHLQIDFPADSPCDNCENRDYSGFCMLDSPIFDCPKHCPPLVRYEVWRGEK